MANGSKSIFAEVLKGAVAGAAAVWVMDRITWYMYQHEDPKAYKQEKEAQVEGKYVAHVAADKMINALGVNVTDQQQYYAGKSIHYLLGMVPAALYAVFRHRAEELTFGRGLAFGLGLFIVMDEITAPLFGLSSGPRAYPWQAHVRGLLGHLAVGATTDAVLKVMDNTTSGMLKSA
jgi:uncharacterized membrane protein YagU involved in acid resistance